jgi:PAS domain S-box-containing protein
MTPVNILLIEDNTSDADLLKTQLSLRKTFSHTIAHVGRLAEGLDLLAGQKFDVVLTDLGLPDSNGLEIITELHKAAPGLPIIVLTGEDDVDVALRAIKLGAQDYLPKIGLNGLLLSRTIQYAIERNESARKLADHEEMLLLLIRHTPAAIAMLDNDMRYLAVSERWLRDFHLEGQDLIGRSHYEVFPDLPERWIEGHKRVLAGGVESCDEDRGRPRTDGSPPDWLRWELRPWRKANGEIGGVIFFIEIINERKQLEAEREKIIEELQSMLIEIKTLSGLLPICGSCKKIRDDTGYWKQIETYVSQHSTASFSHGVCPECAVKTLEASGVPVPQHLRDAAKRD